MLGLLFISRNNVEGLTNINDRYSCSNILLEKDNKIHLYNSKLAKIPGVNPLTFNNLEEYVEFTEWQRSQGIRCPILYLQKSYDAQSNSVYKIHTDIHNNQPGLPDVSLNVMDIPVTKLYDSNHDHPPYNQNEYPGFDPQDQYVGLNTPLDKMFHASGNSVSANPMDNNWGGSEYSQDVVDSGAYKGDEILV